MRVSNCNEDIASRIFEKKAFLVEGTEGSKARNKAEMSNRDRKKANVATVQCTSRDQLGNELGELERARY